MDFFEDQLVQHGYDWRDLLKAYLFEGDKPLINNMICGCKWFTINFDKADLCSGTSIDSSRIRL